MPIVVDATYEGGFLKPAEPLPLDEHQRVRLHVTVDRPLSLDAVAAVRRGYGLLRWKGDVETLDQFINDPDLEYEQ